MFRKLLVATDLTAQSRSALDHAARLVDAFGSRLVVAHVLPMPPSLQKWRAAAFGDDGKAYELLVARQRQRALDELERYLTESGVQPSKRVECVVRAGDPAIVLAALARETAADLTLVARGKRGALGPVAERLVRMVGRAVLVTPVRGATRLALGGPTQKGGRGRRRAAA